MAKSVEIAKARRKKQAQAQARKEREMWNKVRKPLLIAVAAAAVLLIGWIVYSNFIYLPTNGVRVANGALSGADSSWVVANYGTSGKPECIHMASYQAPAGYTLDTSGTVSSSSLTQSLYYKADDPTAVIQTIYVAGVAGQKPDAMVEKLLGNGFFTNSERVENTVLAGFPVACLYSQTGSTNEKG